VHGGRQRQSKKNLQFPSQFSSTNQGKKLFLRDKPVVLDESNDVAPLMPEDSLRVSIVNHGIIQLQDLVESSGLTKSNLKWLV
jgi:hypothetical protein